MLTPDLRSTITSVPMSAMLMALNVAVFVAVQLEHRLLEVLALPPYWAGVAARPWTLLTVFFSAEALVHVGVAVVVIGVFGARLERATGAGHVVGVYLLSGVAGSVALVTTAAATGFDEPSVGASAAFLGLVGALAASPRVLWGERLQVGWVVVVVLVIQAAPVVGIGDWVSSAAHLTGLAAGAGYGLLLRSRTSEQRQAGMISS